MAPPDDTQPLLSVILFGRRFEDIRATVRLLSVQTIAHRIELVLIHPSQSAPVVSPDLTEAFHSCRTVDTQGARSLAASKAVGVRAASAPLIAFGEDHSFPDPNWAEALVAAFDSGYAVVAPRILNGTSDSLLSRVAMILHFAGGHVENDAGYETKTPYASHNISYRRDVLLELGEELGPRLMIESFLLEALRERGYKFWVQPSAATLHMNMCYLAPLLKHAWIGGRMHGALRVRFHRWSAARRLLQVALAPLVPPIMAQRALRNANRSGHLGDAVVGVPAMILVLAFHAAGEATGYLMGLGESDARYSLYEVQRDRFVFPHYRARWA